MREDADGWCRVTRPRSCNQAAVTCPLHSLDTRADARPEGQRLFPCMNQASVLAALRFLLKKVGVEKGMERTT